MNHIEEEYKLQIGRKTFDVSNVPVYKTLRGLDKYNKGVERLQSGEIDAVGFNRICDEIGIDLLRNDYESLRLRFNPFKSLLEKIKRYTVSLKHIYKLNKENYEEWQGWVYFALTGKKKESLEEQKDMTEVASQMFRLAKSEMNLNPEQCLELLMTSLRDQTKELENYTKDHKVS